MCSWGLYGMYVVGIIYDLVVHEFISGLYRFEEGRFRARVYRILVLYGESLAEEF